MKQRSKNIVLLAGIVLMMTMAYRLTFSKTFELREEIGALEIEKTRLQQQMRQTTSLKERERHADSILNKFRIKNRSVQNHLLDFLNEEAHSGDFSIAQFVESHKMANDGVMINSYPFKLKGSYQAIEQVLYQMEQQYTFGKVAHVSFERKNNFRKRIQELECYIIVERFEVEE